MRIVATQDHRLIADQAGRTNGQPAVVLLDLKMPKVDGMEVLRQVKADPELKVIPVVIMTSSHEEQDLVNSYQLGANAYVVKPMKFTEFVAAVTRLGASQRSATGQCGPSDEPRYLKKDIS